MTIPRITVVQAIGARKEGGAEAFYVRFVEALSESSAVSVIPLVAHKSWIADRLADVGIAFETAPFRKWFDFQTPGRILDITKRQHPTIVQTWMGRASSLVPSLNVPVIARLGGPYQLKYFKRCDHLVVNAPNLVDHVVNNNWPRDRVSLIHNFVRDVDLPSDEVRASVRGQLGLADDDVLLSMFGRLHVNKAFDVAIKALSDLPGNVHLQIAGVGPLDSELRELTASLDLVNRVHFRGWVEDVAPLFAATDICLVPSRHEPFGNVVLEAWHHGKPVIAADALGPAGTITDQKDGLLFPIDDVGALTQCIKKLTNNIDFSRSLVDNASRSYKERFSKTKILQTYLKLYRDVLDHHGQGGGRPS